MAIARCAGQRRHVTLDRTRNPWVMTVVVDLDVALEPRGSWSDVNYQRFLARLERVVERGWSRHYLLRATPASVTECSERNPVTQLFQECPAIRDINVTLRVEDRHLTGARGARVHGVEVFWGQGDAYERGGRLQLTLQSVEWTESALFPGAWQIAAVHEVGHLLGLNDVGQGQQGCRGMDEIRPDNPDCYRSSTGSEEDVMGPGMHVPRSYYERLFAQLAAAMCEHELGYGYSWEPVLHTGRRDPNRPPGYNPYTGRNS